MAGDTAWEWHDGQVDEGSNTRVSCSGKRTARAAGVEAVGRSSRSNAELHDTRGSPMHEELDFIPVTVRSCY